MRSHRLLLCCLVTAASAVAVSDAPAQPSFPAPPVVTIWHRLGIPQGLNRLNSSMVNRRGNFPGLERKPPLRRIADPANLESSNPAIKTAAEVKMQEDMAKQKIKAIKYLADLGCDDCYPGITDALIAALDDCTEKVRYEAAKAIRKSVEENCSTCNKACCCKEEMTKKLAEVAFELDDECCYKERSERVREEAAQALRTCCPNCMAGMPIEEMPETVPATEAPPVEGPMQTAPPVEGPPSQPTPAEEIVPPPVTDPTAGLQMEMEDGTVLVLDGAAHEVEISDAATEAPRPTLAEPAVLSMPSIGVDDSNAVAPSAAPRRIAGPPRGATPLVSYRLPSDEAPPGEENLAARTPVLALAQPVAEQVPDEALGASPVRGAALAGARGHVALVDLSTQTVQLKFHEGLTPQVGARVVVFHKFLLETAELGQLVIVDVQQGSATARPQGEFPLRKVAKGDTVTVR